MLYRKTQPIDIIKSQLHPLKGQAAFVNKGALC
jgi:hypothetical protein